MCSSISNGNPICGLNISLVTNPTEDKEFEESIVSQINSIQTEIWKTINTLKTASEGNSDQLKNQFIQVIESTRNLHHHKKCKSMWSKSKGKNQIFRNLLR